MIDNTFKRYLLVEEPQVGSYYVVDTVLKANTESRKDIKSALPCTTYEAFSSYERDIVNICLKQNIILAESDYPITFKAHPELLI